MILVEYVLTKRKLSTEQECVATKQCKYNEDESLCNITEQTPVVQIAERSDAVESDMLNPWKSKCFEKFKIKKVSVQDEGFTARYTDFCFSVLDEICLEGLDGITLEGNSCLVSNTMHV